MVASGADRVAANGDTANKIGTLSLAVNARRCGRATLFFPPLGFLVCRFVGGIRRPPHGNE